MNGGKIFVAGASGLIGTNLLLRLLSEGRDARGSWRSAPPTESLRAHCGHFDFLNYEDCVAATKGCESVFISANSVAPASVMRAEPTSSILPNLRITAGLLEACARNRVHRVVLISSATVYAESAHPISEDELDLNEQPFPLYRAVGWFHRYAEQLALTHHALGNFGVGIARASAVFGPFDHFEPERSQVIPANIRKACEKQTPFVVWGDGKEIRDFHYVRDLIDDLIVVLEKGCGGESWNSGSGSPRSIREAVQSILRAAGHHTEIVHDVSRPGAIPYRALNVEKLNQLRGRRDRTDFDVAMAETVSWYREHRKS